MALTAAEQKFITWIEGVLPRYFFASDRTKELISGFAKLFESARSTGELWFDQTLIGQATNLPPDFLDLHALDRGTRRQENESDEDLRQRLQNIPDALTLSAVLDAVDATLAAAGITGTAYIMELRAGKAFFQDNLPETGTGGEFTIIGGDVSFTPDVPFDRPPNVGEDITFSGAASAGNDGTFEILDLDENAVQYVNASAVQEVDATVSWSVNRKDADGNIITGFKDAYFSRGHRMGSAYPQPVKPTFIVILPYGSTAATAASVQENLRQKKGAGVIVLVEYRQSP